MEYSISVLLGCVAVGCQHFRDPLILQNTFYILVCLSVCQPESLAIYLPRNLHFVTFPSETKSKFQSVDVPRLEILVTIRTQQNHSFDITVG
jgi:hypothetical protein